MAEIISVGIQKGGCGKSTLSSVLTFALSQDYKVLAVDMDGQGNLTQLLTSTDDIFQFDATTVYDAILDQDATDYILEIEPNLHILAGSENVNTLAPHFHVELAQKGIPYHYCLKNALGKVADNYDYIIIDTPPALGELSIISLAASNKVLVMFETSKFCYNSLQSYMKTIQVAQDRVNEDLEIAGILRNMIDRRRIDNKHWSDLVAEEFPDICFETIITRSAAVGRVPTFGLRNNPEIKKVMKSFEPFLKELKANVLTRPVEQG